MSDEATEETVVEEQLEELKEEVDTSTSEVSEASQTAEVESSNPSPSEETEESQADDSDSLQPAKSYDSDSSKTYRSAVISKPSQDPRPEVFYDWLEDILSGESDFPYNISSDEELRRRYREITYDNLQSVVDDPEAHLVTGTPEHFFSLIESAYHSNLSKDEKARVLGVFLTKGTDLDIFEEISSDRSEYFLEEIFTVNAGWGSSLPVGGVAAAENNATLTDTKIRVDQMAIVGYSLAIILLIIGFAFGGAEISIVGYSVLEFTGRLDFVEKVGWQADFLNRAGFL